jgi:ribokinase
MGRVIVVGSINIDLVVHVERLPRPGETVAGGDLARHHGGKGGNQAVAAARLGASVAFVGAVGSDDFGESALAALAAEGVDTAHVRRLDRPTGVALIIVGGAGQNVIAVAPGANSGVDEPAVEQALRDLGVGGGDVVLASREVAPTAVSAALRDGRRAGATTILNPAPPDGLDAATARMADVLTPNQAELSRMGGSRERTAALARLMAEDATRWLAVTLGAAGALLVGPGGDERRFPAPRVEAVDTTGAGDAFNGALAALLAQGRGMPEAVPEAIAAASYSTLRRGAREGMVTAAQLAELRSQATPGG